MKAWERLLVYAAMDTESEDRGEKTPSTENQFALARYLKEELRSLGISAETDEHAFVYAAIPASKGCENAPKLALLAHMDTAPDFTGKSVKPVLHPQYDGGDVELGGGKVLSVQDFPHLPSLKGRTLLTTDGTTLLGADDKAGIAEIVTMAEVLLASEIPHGPLRLCFTPDEEIGTGIHAINLEKLDAEIAYTVDGGPEGEIQYENFNAASAKVEFLGFNVHPGSSKNTMRNAQLMAMEFNSLLPGMEIPRHTEGYEGFFHLCHMSGSVERAELEYIIRDHSGQRMEARQETLRHIAKCLNEKHGEGTVQLEIKEQYRNMAQKIQPSMYLIDVAKAAAEAVGITPRIVPVRGGTDGAHLSWQGLPCPNLGTGGYAYHGPYEHITAEGMNLTVELLLEIVKRISSLKKECVSKKH